MKTTSNPVSHDLTPSHSLVTARARELWEASGRPADRDLEFWYEAERQLRASVPVSTVAPGTTARSSSKKARDVDGLGAKTEEMLGRIGATSSGSPTALDLGPR